MDYIPREKPRVTFSVTILRQEHNSWQGELRWLEGKRRKTFRSTLEMIRLIDSACEISNEECERQMEEEAACAND